MTNGDRYRRGVGIMLLNGDGNVFVGARIDNTDEAWQMPQGGIDDADQDEWSTALRELEEETGIAPRLVEKISATPERLKYDLPNDLRRKLWGGKFKGQDQDWFLARFLGSDSDINIHTKHPEFREWKWIKPSQLPDLIVPFKRDLYRQLLSEFADHL
jgi:putative (di)nucleoside polyphosphate hydrolase